VPPWPKRGHISHDLIPNNQSTEDILVFREGADDKLFRARAFITILALVHMRSMEIHAASLSLVGAAARCLPVAS